MEHKPLIGSRPRMPDSLVAAVEYIRSRISLHPEIGMITGTGLSSLTDRMDIECRVFYGDIPHFPTSTTQGHSGTLAIGKLSGRATIALEGRFHLYEGYTPQQVAFPVRVFAMLGVKYLLISSAAGGLNPQFETGDLMIVTDHINLTGSNPLTGPNLESLGPRFPDMAAAYTPELVTLARRTALELRIPVRQGVYAGVMGPSLETPAETRFLRLIGADAVGMSTVSEAIAAVHCGMQLMAIVVITNMNLPDCMRETSIETVIAMAEESGKPLSGLWEKIIGNLGK